MIISTYRAGRAGTAGTATTVADDGCRLPTVVLCARGATDPAGRRLCESIAGRLAMRRPELTVEVGYIDVQEPQIGDLVRHLTGARRRPVVVVPLLLSSGRHIAVDIAQAVADNPLAVSTGPLGPDPIVTAAVVDRLVAAGAHSGDGVVLSVTGASDQRGRDDAETVVDTVRHLWAGPVVAAYGAGVGGAVAALRAGGVDRVGIAAYVVAAGEEYYRLWAAGADIVTKPLGVDSKIVSVVEQRFAAGAWRLAKRGVLDRQHPAATGIATVGHRPVPPPVSEPTRPLATLAPA